MPLPPPDSIDRLAPAREPAAPALLRQNWHHLLFIDFASTRHDSRSPATATSHFRYRPMDGVAPAAPNTLDFFLVERYILYATDAEGTLYRARVHHQPYPLQRVDVLECDETLTQAAGVRLTEGNPLRHYAREVNVKVFPLEIATLKAS